MASKKEPPFFNEDTIGTCHCELAFYDIMEIIIETLTGTCFELRVSPFETVISVKSKIQRLEGIPVSQQHLIWNDEELEDDYGLNDYEISEGCTLKLILAMRGGPINTRRVPVADPIREITEYMDPSQDDLWEKIPSNNHATFLVYREGDQLNFFRIVDRGDGTLTPISESLSAGSVYNLCTENNEDKEPCPSSQQMIENSITMNKMKLLKMKMENINLSKKSSGVGLNGNIVNTGKRASDPTHFPPVNGSAQSKKKITNHCFFCGKKTGLSTSYEYVETISVPLTAMQRLTHVPMTTRMQGGGICRRPIPSSQHQSSLKSKPSFVARICFLEELLSY
ncbi:AN1-type zinc finger protein 4 isoform X7 [Anolis carolinensis]|uniref:AN1-type zinc finger protein 4 isoform X7 n=1 Tax=Anolis carolinensis TaxID=28377 RepID=UPI002F2B6134